MTLLTRVRDDFPVGLGSDLFGSFDAFFNDLKRVDKAGFSPLLDIREDEKAYFLDIELPGIPKEDVKMEVSDGRLIVSGEKKSQREDDYHRVERVYGSFTRALNLPEDVDEKKIEAKMRDGVLHVTLGKKKEKEPKINTIEIK